MKDHQTTQGQTKQAPRSGSRSTQQAPRSRKTQGAQNQYERYTELARAEALNGNHVEAENYYQHAEHYFRSAGAAERPTPTGL
ncbi:hypothetical protein C5748_00180 [Phyllobacterium phragmitis]|uniref:DUF4167 domain-containing protein n=2 Tax=Phyllobacterium phragmitis TaxID=2670329 RepID=A0A2S9IYM3_9HYPH|nr:hypothetical protein C5748_00180 [Phyllobacterium phragmitis]